MNRGAFAVFAGLLGVAGSASAHELKFSAELLGSAQLPANGSAGVGTVLITMDMDLIVMNVQLAFADLAGTTTTPQIHGLTTQAATGSAISAVPMPEFPSAALSGMYTQTIDLTTGDSYTPAFITASGGTIFDALYTTLGGLIHGQTYFNINSSAFPNGEIRGFLRAFPDANEDGTINSLDFNAVAENFNLLGTELDTGDFNLDGTTNAMDFNAIASRYGDSVDFPEAAVLSVVPEPGMGALISVAVLIAARQIPHEYVRDDVFRAANPKDLA